MLAARLGEPVRLSAWLRATAPWLAVTVAVLLAYTAVWPNTPYRATDTDEYLGFARAIAAGIDEPQARTPGLPLFLLAVGTGRGLFLISLLLHLGAVGLLMSVLRSLGIGRKHLWLFGVIALLPPFVQKDAYILTEGLTEFLIAAGFAALRSVPDSTPLAAVCGLALSLAAITRPQNQLLPFLAAGIMAFYFGWQRVRRSLPALLLPPILLIGGLRVHNQIKFGYSGLTYQLGENLGTRTVTLFDKIPDPAVRDIMVSARNAAYGHGNPYWTTWDTRPALMRLKGFTAPQLARYMGRIHLQLILQHPLAYLEEVERAFCHFWSPDLPQPTNRSPAIRSISTLTQVGVCAAFWVAFVLAAGLAMGSLFLPIPSWLPDIHVRFLYTTAFTLIAYTALLSAAIDIGEPRHRGPVDLLILFVVVVTGHYVANSHRRQLSNR